jgi:hypothetical protein
MKSGFEALVRFSMIALDAPKFQFLSRCAGFLKATPLAEKIQERVETLANPHDHRRMCHLGNVTKSYYSQAKI